MDKTNIAIWRAVDEFAKDRGLTCSGLARTCGLNSTVFNKSKRTTKYEQQRWLSTETITKVVNTYGMDIHDFFNQYVPRQNNNKL